MKQLKEVLLGVLTASVVLVVPLAVPAQIIDSYEPTAYDYGNVEIGESKIQIFTVTLQDVGDLLYVFSMLTIDNPADGDPTPYEGTSFTITSQPPTGLIPSGTSFEVEVTFNPITEGAHAVYLRMLSNERLGNDDLRIPLFGMGVPVETPPQEELSEILTFIANSVSNESLQGSGPGNSANGRLKALINMIEASGDLIEDGFIEQACQQLLDAYDRTDGYDSPPDFVGGEATVILANMILDLMEGLGCE